MFLASKKGVAKSVISIMDSLGSPECWGRLNWRGQRGKAGLKDTAPNLVDIMEGQYINFSFHHSFFLQLSRN